MSKQVYCPNCFSPAYDGLYCTECAYTSQNDDDSIVLPAGTILENRYYIGRVLGIGGFGITYLSFDLPNQIKVAIKEFFPSQIAIRYQDGTVSPSERNINNYQYAYEQFLSEAITLSTFNDTEFTAKIFDVIQTNNTAYMVMEFIDGINLKQYIESLPQLPDEKEAETILINIAFVLNSMHQRNLLHRDISPENILRKTDGTVKLIDFGAARFFAGEQSKSLSVVLKPGFAPPEQYSSKGIQGPWTDIYALASTIYYFLTKNKIPNAMDRLAGETYYPITDFRSDVSPRMIACIEKSLNINYKNRYTTIDVLLSDLIQTNNRNDKTVLRKPENFFGQFKSKINNLISSSPKTEKVFLEIRFIGSVMRGQSFQFRKKKRLTIGRSDQCDVEIKGSTVISRVHCEIRYDETRQRFMLKDKSSNGVYIGNERNDPNREYLLNSGESFYLADDSCEIVLIY